MKPGVSPITVPGRRFPQFGRNVSDRDDSEAAAARNRGYPSWRRSCFPPGQTPGKRRSQMPPQALRLALFLADPGNDWVRAIGHDATQAARRHGFQLTTQYSENQAVEQIQQIYG